MPRISLRVAYCALWPCKSYQLKRLYPKAIRWSSSFGLDVVVFVLLLFLLLLPGLDAFVREDSSSMRQMPNDKWTLRMREAFRQNNGSRGSDVSPESILHFTRFEIRNFEGAEMN